MNDKRDRSSIAVFILLVLVLVPIVLRVGDDETRAQPRESNAARSSAEILQRQWSRGMGVGKGPVQFTHAPIQAEDIAMIVPLGLMSGGAHVTPSDHQYYQTKDKTESYDVRVPADGVIVAIQHRTSFQGTTAQPRSPASTMNIASSPSIPERFTATTIQSLDSIRRFSNRCKPTKNAAIIGGDVLP